MIRLVGGETNAFFRQRIVLAVLSARSVRLDDIRSHSTEPGLTDAEVDFLRLIDLLTQGTKVDISHTGTALSFKPGIIVGGEVTHNCNVGQPIGYYLEFLMLLAPFSKFAFKLSLSGVTTCSVAFPSVDILRAVAIPQLAHFASDEPAELRIIKRGANPLGGGSIFFSCPVIAQSRAFCLIDEGRVLKIRGVASTTRVSPQVANRLVESAKGLCNQFLPDTYIYTDVAKGSESGLSPGYNLSLVAESTSGALHYAEASGYAQAVPEDIGLAVAQQLLTKISQGGFVDSDRMQHFLMAMTVGPADVFKITTAAPLSQQLTLFMEELRIFFEVTFKVGVKECTDGSQVCLITGFGIGFTNVGKRTQ